ncbi:hypothetical protein GCM10023162_26000 [Klenkia terrae]
MPSRRMWIIAGTVVGVVAVGAVAGPLVYAALQEDAPPATTVQAQDSDAPLTDVTDGTWTIGAGSSAGYRVDEVLNGDDVTVAGTTDQVTGSLVVSGGDLQSAEVDVDMASVATDSGRRDSYFRDNVIDVAANPTATFAVTQAVDLPELTGTPVTVPVAGELSVHGVTQQVTVDYDVTPPDLGFVSVEDTGSVEFFLVLTQ